MIAVALFVLSISCKSLSFFSPVRQQRACTLPHRNQRRVTFTADVHVAEYDRNDGIRGLGTEDMQPGVLESYTLPDCGPQEVERQELLARFVKCNHMITYWERRCADEGSTGFFSGRLGVLGVDPEKWVIIDLPQAMGSIPEIVEEIRERERHALLRKALHHWPRPRAWQIKLKQLKKFWGAAWQSLVSMSTSTSVSVSKHESKCAGKKVVSTTKNMEVEAAVKAEPRGKVRRRGSGKKGREPARLRAG
mmetsp:Transcript_678/g.412  ORF Transcript_678/g.412 Transcript_678/m.412 type:complete len:249 (+) Transcript_678:3-749(+)